MCGISGLVNSTEILDKNIIHEMSNSMSHRGPDAHGVFISESKKVQLAHRRLSILDLSDNSNQPMISNCGNYILVFNGEIYNYEELRKELQTKHAIQFTTNSDTEVLLKGFIIWKEKVVNRLNGMFSFAIYENENNTLWIFRDRIGIKPIYYYWDQKIFAFASELKGISYLQTQVGQFKENKQALMSFFRLGYIPSPNTIFQEVKKFPSGSYAKFQNEKLEFYPYWKSENYIQKEYQNQKAQAKNELHELLQSSIELRMKSDVAFGSFLSGGVDSSTVSAIAQSQSDSKLNTFSIGFNESKYNESIFAKQVAKHIGSDHHEHILSYQDALALIPEIFKSMDEPFADSSLIPTYLVSKMARRKVKMALSGDGGDEQFFGYGMYKWAKRLNNPFLKTFRHPIAATLKASASNRKRRASAYFDYQKNDFIPAHIFSCEQNLFSECELKNLFLNEFERTEFNQIANFNRKLTADEKQAFFDLNFYLQDDLLVKVDRASMMNSLEVRVPLLDHRIIEFTLNLSTDLKRNGHDSKYLLKQILYDYVPKEFFNRPKWGFSIPMESWLKKELYFLIETHLSKSEIESTGMLNWNYVQTIINRYKKGETYLYNRLWLIIVYQMWRKTFYV